MSFKNIHRLRARQLGLDTHAEMMVFLRRDSPICRSEGFTSHNRVALSAGAASVIATLYQVDSDFLAVDEAGLSETTWRHLQVKAGDPVTVRHAPPVDSLKLVRGRIFGHAMNQAGLDDIIADIVAGRYSAIEIASFITACAAAPLSQTEISSLTAAMVKAGDRLSWNSAIVADKHSVGGLPGNRTTPIIVSIAASLGLCMPKTSSRAITSPAGTADTMETLAPVELSAAQMRKVVEQEGGCVVCGGGVRLSPADDVLIRIEQALDIDSEGQMVASVLSKKIAAGATHLVLDMPVGPTAKVRNSEAAAALTQSLMTTAQTFGICARVVVGDGNQPVGRGMGPALEAREVLAVLQGKPEASQDLRVRALALTGALLEVTGKAVKGTGVLLATQALDDGRAWAKFQRICEAQGGMREPPRSSHRKSLAARNDGILKTIDNRRLARLAKLAGAPHDKAAGVELHVRLGDKLAQGAPICTVHAETPGELAYALSYAHANPTIFGIGEP